MNLFDIGDPKPPGQAIPHNMRCTPGINGNGPEGETCGTCAHIFHHGKYLKCGLCRAHWTHGAATDIRARWPACEKWEAIPNPEARL